MPIGTPVTGKMVAALKRLGFDKVYDTDFGADLTIMEEANELVERINDAYPSVSLEVDVDSTPDLKRGLLSGKLDIAFLGEKTTDPALKIQSLCSYRLGWCAGEKLSASKRRPDLAEAWLNRGITRLDTAQGVKEVISLEFDDQVTLHVPLQESHLISRYVGLSKTRPQLGRIGSGRWEKARQAAERATIDLAAELLRIHAAREAEPGHAFPPDTAWQKEFEASFPFTETRDQLRAIAETKAMLHRNLAESFDDALAEMSVLSDALFASDEGQEGMRSFLEKRPPVWRR